MLNKFIAIILTIFLGICTVNAEAGPKKHKKTATTKVTQSVVKATVVTATTPTDPNEVPQIFLKFDFGDCSNQTTHSYMKSTLDSLHAELRKLKTRLDHEPRWQDWKSELDQSLSRLYFDILQVEDVYEDAGWGCGNHTCQIDSTGGCHAESFGEIVVSWLGFALYEYKELGKAGIFPTLSTQDQNTVDEASKAIDVWYNPGHMHTTKDFRMDSYQIHWLVEEERKALAIYLKATRKVLPVELTSAFAYTPTTWSGYTEWPKIETTTTITATYAPHSACECDIVTSALRLGNNLTSEATKWSLTRSMTDPWYGQIMAIVRTYKPEEHSDKCASNATTLLLRALEVLNVLEVRRLVDVTLRGELTSELDEWGRLYRRQKELSEVRDFAAEYRHTVLKFLGRIYNSVPPAPSHCGIDDVNGWWHKGMLPWDYKWFVPPISRPMKF